MNEKRQDAQATALSASTAPQPSEKLRLEVMGLLWQLESALRGTSRRMHERLGLTGPQRFLLRTLQLSPGLSCDDAASVLRLHPRNFSGVVARLEKQGMLKRDEDVASGRLALTPAAEATLLKAEGTLEAVVEQALEVLPGPAERQGVARFLLTLVLGLDAQEAAPARDGMK